MIKKDLGAFLSFDFSYKLIRKDTLRPRIQIKSFEFLKDRHYKYLYNEILLTKIVSRKIVALIFTLNTKKILSK